ncbi:MAG: hypothetical protein IH944_10345 [Armatimonadetes bacterium]|nr:hypothetical protein [Armatimonadota bacterium]
MFGRFVGLFLASLVVSAPAAGQIVITLDTQPGASLFGEHRFTALVQSQSLVTQVEFYVNGDLVATDESTPYEFVMDTLMYDEGEVMLTISAYNRDGESAKLDVKLTIDNALGKGIEYHIDRANEAVVNQNWDEAIQICRIALKIDSSNNDARMAIARAYFGKGVYDMAQKFAEDILADDPGNTPAKSLLSGIGLRQAFSAVESGMDRDQALDTLASAMKMATEARMEVLEAQIETAAQAAAGKDGGPEWFAYVDTLISTGRYSTAIGELSSPMLKNPDDNAIANRIIYAQIRAGRTQAALRSLREHEREGYPDAYGYSLKAILMEHLGEDQAALDAEREAILEDAGSLGVRTTQAYLALRRGRGGALQQITRSLATSEGQSPITNYYLAAMYYRQNQFQLSEKAFQAALLADPAMYDMYIERANQALSFLVANALTGKEKAYQLRFAEAFTQAALIARPESFEALTAQALIYLYRDELDDALRFAQAAVQAGPEYGAAHNTLALALSLTGQSFEGVAQMEKAGAADPAYLAGATVPTLNRAWDYFFRHGRTPLIVPPSSGS